MGSGDFTEDLADILFATSETKNKEVLSFHNSFSQSQVFFKNMTWKNVVHCDETFITSTENKLKFTARKESLSISEETLKIKSNFS